MRLCPSCGSEVDENARFCTECGWPLAKTKKARLVRPALAILFVLVFVPILCLASLYSQGIVDPQELFQEKGGSSHISSLAPTPTPTPGHSPALECKFVETTENGITYIQTGADGHKIRLCDNPEATDVTWSELKDFLRQDKTDEIPYNEGIFVCGDYAEMLHNNAESAGIRAAWVGIDFYYSDVGHAVNAFNTIDQGLVFIDVGNADMGRCSSDKIATLRTGKQITFELVFSCSDFSLLPMEGVVKEILITW